MNAIAEKMKDAGVDTVGARLVAACTEGLRRHPDSVIDAWHYAGSVFGHEFVRGLLGDMRKHEAPKQQRSTAAPMIAQPAPYKPRVIPQERLERRRQIQQIVRSKYKNSGGVLWSDVGWHELHGLKRDGNEAIALLEAGPANVPNDGRTVGDVLGVKRTDEIIAVVRGLK